MIRSFKCKETERVFNRRFSSKLSQAIQKISLRKLGYLHAAKDVNDLLIPPANHLEHLGGDRKGQYSIRINKQWRICFEWYDGNAYDVEIVDYH